MIELRMEVENVKEVQQRLGALGRKTPSVIANAINRTLTNIRKNMAQQTAQRYNVASGEVKKTIAVKKATREKLSGAAVSKASPIALSKFKVSPNRPVSYSKGKRPSPKVYKVSVEKGPASKALDVNPKAFIAVMQSGHHGLFRRVSDESLPIKQLFGPSAPQMIKNNETIDYIQKEAQSTLQKRIDAEVENILRKG